MFIYKTPLDDGSQQLPDFPSCTEQRFSSKNITTKMVSGTIYYLDASKATGPTEFQPLFLRCVLQSFLMFLLSYIYNKCLAESCFPSCWKSSSVVQVFKNDGKYRPVNRPPIISKIFESY